MSKGKAEKLGSRDNVRLSRIATEYLNGKLSREEVCKALNAEAGESGDRGQRDDTSMAADSGNG